MARVAFLQKTCWDFIGIMSISAVLKAAGHECDVFIEEQERNLTQCILDYQPNLVAFSVTTNGYNWPLRQSIEIKKKCNAKIILGGIHPTIFPEIITEDSVDIICRGEGEYPMLELMNMLDAGKDYSDIENLWVKKDGEIKKNPIRPRIKDLNEIPPLDHELYYKYQVLRSYPVRNIMITRGCPYSCSFCFNHQINKLYQKSGGVIRRKNIENSIRELEWFKNYKTRLICFIDDTFNLDKKWLFEFLEVYRNKISLPFYCNLRVDLLDRETVIFLKRAGVYSVAFGVETGNEKRRNDLLKKTISNKQLLDAAELLREFQIYTFAESMLGLPGETMQTSWETLDIIRKIKPTYAWCSVFQPYPRLSLTEKAAEEGLVKGGLESFAMCTYYENSLLDIPHIDNICNLQKLFNVAVKFPRMDYLIKILIKLPMQKVYLLVFLVSHGCGMRKILNLSYRDIFQKGLLMLKSYFKK